MQLSETSNDDEIQALVKRLARPHPSGGTTVERAAILAAGADSSRVIAWITAHDGEPEAQAAAASTGLHGLHSSNQSATVKPPARYVLPANAL
jgi:hypothetical protein